MKEKQVAGPTYKNKGALKGKRRFHVLLQAVVKYVL
jgi:hypothetical protein